MKFIIVLVALCAVFAMATAAPRPCHYPYYNPQQVYGGGGASAYSMIDANSGYYGNNIYGGYAPQYGGYNPGYPGSGSVWM